MDETRNPGRQYPGQYKTPSSYGKPKQPAWVPRNMLPTPKPSRGGSAWRVWLAAVILAALAVAGIVWSRQSASAPEPGPSVSVTS